MKIYERFLDAYTEMLSRFFDFGKKTMFLANDDVQRSYERLENEDRLMKVLIYLVIEIYKALKTLLVVGFFILTSALLTGIYWVLNRIYAMTTR